MKYKIWHAKKPTFGFGDVPKFPEEYETVAVVEAEGLEDAFRLTNHISSNWTHNAEVVDLFKRASRSTSVGDVVEDESGSFYYCDMAGWKELELSS